MKPDYLYVPFVHPFLRELRMKITERGLTLNILILKMDGRTPTGLKAPFWNVSLRYRKKLTTTSEYFGNLDRWDCDLKYFEFLREITLSEMRITFT